MNVTYYVVVPFDRNEEGDLVAGDAKEATGALSAERGARTLALEHAGAVATRTVLIWNGLRTLALEHAGAVAFSRTGDPSTGDFQDAVILAQFGVVDLNALSE